MTLLGVLLDPPTFSATSLTIHWGGGREGEEGGGGGGREGGREGGRKEEGERGGREEDRG